VAVVIGAAALANWKRTERERRKERGEAADSGLASRRDIAATGANQLGSLSKLWIRNGMAHAIGTGPSSGGRIGCEIANFATGARREVQVHTAGPA
jgi:hypothetical protein